MSNVMPISVIIPAYRAEDYVTTAARSACALDVVDEVLIVEDGSPDRTLEVCLDLQREESKVRVLRHADGNNRGASASRNLGIKHARNDYIAFLDADDYFLRNRFDYDVRIFQKSDDVDGVYGALGTAFLTESAEEIYRRAKLPLMTTISSPVPPDQLIYVLMGASQQARGHFSLDALTVRKRVFQKSGLFDTKLTYSQDTDFIIRMAVKGTLIAGNISEPVAMRGVHDHNRVTNSRQVNRGRHRLWNKLYTWGKESGMPPDLVELCRLRAISWKTHELSFGRGLAFLAMLRSRHPEVWEDPRLFRRAITGTLGNNKLAAGLCKIHRIML